MTRIFSLAYLTAGGADPGDAAELAARTGYHAIGPRLLPTTPGGHYAPLVDDAAALREAIRRIKASGIAVFDVEIVRIGPTFDVARVAKFLDVCEALGARAILVASDDPDESRFVNSFACFCEAAARHKLTADLEFMPWTCVKDCATATRLVETADQPNGGVLIDALHWNRSRSSLDDVRAIPKTRLHYAQICDGPAAIPSTDADMIHAARHERLLPGAGGIDLAGLFGALPSSLSASLPISIEIPNDREIARLGLETWARSALDAAKSSLATSIAQ